MTLPIGLGIGYTISCITTVPDIQPLPLPLYQGWNPLGNLTFMASSSPLCRCAQPILPRSSSLRPRISLCAPLAASSTSALSSTWRALASLRMGQGENRGLIKCKAQVSQTFWHSQLLNFCPSRNNMIARRGKEGKIQSTGVFQEWIRLIITYVCPPGELPLTVLP